MMVFPPRERCNATVRQAAAVRRNRQGGHSVERKYVVDWYDAKMAELGTGTRLPQEAL
jgi:hypothetical protein